jgi:hypothetical protein
MTTPYLRGRGASLPQTFVAGISTRSSTRSTSHGPSVAIADEISSSNSRKFTSVKTHCTNVPGEARIFIVADEHWGTWRAGVVWTDQTRHAWGVYDNELHVVTVTSLTTSWGLMTHVAIRRKDQKAATWDEAQRIKNELVGTEATAIEVYPKGKVLVNQAPVRHLWVLPKGFGLPFGLTEVAGPQ